MALSGDAERVVDGAHGPLVAKTDGSKDGLSHDFDLSYSMRPMSTIASTVTHSGGQ